jgi:hypothetical protein
MPLYKNENQFHQFPFGSKDAGSGFEPLLKVLQTLACPLGHPAMLLYPKRIKAMIKVTITLKPCAMINA